MTHRDRSKYSYLLLPVLVLPYFLNLQVSSLWDANEAFYAGTPREMIESGDYLAPRFNYQPRTQKPPLTYWLIAASYRLLGIEEFAVRLPGALAATGVVLFVFLAVRDRFGPKAAVLGAAITATCPRIFLLARRLPIDILLIFWLTGTAFFVMRALARHSRTAWAAAYVFAALGFMTKGPVSLVVPAGALALWCLWTGRLRWRELHLCLGASVAAFVILPWYVAIYVRDGWTYISPFFLRDNLGRFTTEVFGPARGPFYYLPAFLADFFPWSIIAVALLAMVLLGGDAWRRCRESWFAFPVVWCVWVFLLFSLSRNKQEYYIAPLYPVLAAAIAGAVDRLLLRRPVSDPPRTLWAWTQAGLALLLLAASVGAWFFIRLALPEAGVTLDYLPPAILAAAAVALGVGALKGDGGKPLAVLAGSQWFVILTLVLLFLPAIEPFRPIPALCSDIERESHASDAAGYYRVAVPSMSFYLRRPIFEEFQAESMERLLRSDRRVFCLMSESDYEYFVGSRDLILYVLDRRQRLVTQLRMLTAPDTIADDELLLVSNRRPPHLAANRNQ